MALTNIQCKQAVPKEKPYKMAAGGGLYLLVNPNGSKYWRYKYRFGGKEKTMALGVYPETTLAKATSTHQAARDLLAAHIDPMETRKEQIKDDVLTFKVVAGKWREHWRVGKTEKHVGEVWHRLEVDIFPAIGSKPVSELTATMVRKAVKAIEARGAIDMAKRQLQKCNQIMRYAVAHDLAERNPVADIQPSDILPARKKRNYSRVDAKELPQLLRDISNYVGGADPGARAIRMLKGKVPGANLWYTKAATDRLIFNQLQEAASPGYLRRMERRARREVGHEYFWGPGDITPSRGPDLTRIRE